jgi:phenylalanyl-tRNA synthetase beta chain
MKLPLPWLRDYVDVTSTAKQVAARLSGCGFDVASFEDDVLDVDVWANRPDALSVYGLAREAAAAFDLPLKAAPGEGPAVAAAATAPTIPVSIGDAGCARYALATADVQIGHSPPWLAERLASVGVRPINNVVDITNYVMLEMGHPMHAFDVAHLKGPEIRVRRARAGEKLVTLDGQPRELDETMLVIADREAPIAVAGVMGGKDSEVSSKTTRIALESAWFHPATVRSTSKRLGLKTEASARFERGADLTAPVRALQRALALLKSTGSGQPAGPVTDIYPRQAPVRQVALRRNRIGRLLGQAIPDADVTRILTRLAFKVAATPEGWTVEVPPFRVDVTREADLIEEVGRHWGFDRIPATFPAVRAPSPEPSPGVLRDRRARQVLVGAGLQEAVTFTFIAADAAAPFVSPDRSALTIANPLSEKFAVLRPSLLPGLLDSLAHSRRRETDTVRLFEIGATFDRTGERASAGWILTGSRGDHWSERDTPLDFFDASGLAAVLAAEFGVALRLRAVDGRPWLARGRAAEIVLGEGDAGAAGWVGQIQTDLVQARGLTAAEQVFGGELDLEALAAAGRNRPSAIQPLPRFPSIVRDVSIVVDERLPAAEVRGTIRASAPPTLVSIREFDRYRGQGVPAGQVSLSFRLTFRDAERTLTDSEVQDAVSRVVRALEAAHGAKLRGST